ncbi:MAG: hypothetical protein ACKO7B_09550, partial [Flavobacteriales bacterium]
AKYTGGVEAITSGFQVGDKVIGLDHYGYNLFEGSLSGPLLFAKDEKGQKGRPLLGFFVSGNYTDIVDGAPQYGGVMRMKESVRQELLINPLRPNISESGEATGVLYNADFLTPDDFEKTMTRMNARNRSANMVAKIDVNTSENVTLTFGGTAALSRGRDATRSNQLMNWDNNQLNTAFDWRAYAKFSQRFKNAEGDEASASNLKNIFYSVMVDYSRNFFNSQDETHGDRLFNYGHVGYFDIYRGNTYEQLPGSYFKQTGFQDINTFFTPSEFNPDLAAITNQYYQGAQQTIFYQAALGQLTDANGNLISDRNQIFLDNPGTIAFLGINPAANLNNLTAANGLRNGDAPPATYNLWSYLGAQNNNYGVFSNNQFRVTGIGSADIGDHAIQMGFEFE